VKRTLCPCSSASLTHSNFSFARLHSFVWALTITVEYSASTLIPFDSRKSMNSCFCFPTWAHVSHILCDMLHYPYEIENAGVDLGAADLSTTPQSFHHGKLCGRPWWLRFCCGQNNRTVPGTNLDISDAIQGLTNGFGPCIAAANQYCRPLCFDLAN
jgi:uncharacterized membrane protein YhdT